VTEGDAADGLHPWELVPVEGGTWSGLLFDNPRLGLPAHLTWRFRFPFEEVNRDYGSSPIFLDIEWLSLPDVGWRSVTGQAVRGATWPVESSVYFFEHHRYDMIDLEIVEQRDVLVRARAVLTGDRDGLGIDPISGDAWLRFGGIRVHLSDVDSAESALVRLQTFTTTEGLSYLPTPASPSFRFAPSDS
jgi:hypothetical protein